MVTATQNGTAHDILNAAILPDVETPADPLAGLIDALNSGPIEPGTLATREYQDVDKNGRVRAAWSVTYSTDHTTVEASNDLYAASVGKMVLSTKTNGYDAMLRDMALVRGGTRAYVPLMWKRDDAGFKTIERKLVTQFRKAAERLAIVDRAAHHRFDYARFSVMPASDTAPADVAAYVRIVFTGTRVK